MSQDVVVSITYAQVGGFPQGSAVDHILVTCVSDSGVNDQAPQSAAPDAASVTFANLPADSYTFGAQGYPASGAGYGNEVTTRLTVAGPPQTVTLNLPSTLAAAQQ